MATEHETDGEQRGKLADFRRSVPPGNPPGNPPEASSEADFFASGPDVAFRIMGQTGKGFQYVASIRAPASMAAVAGALQNRNRSHRWWETGGKVAVRVYRMVGRGRDTTAVSQWGGVVKLEPAPAAPPAVAPEVVATGGKDAPPSNDPMFAYIIKRFDDFDARLRAMELRGGHTPVASGGAMGLGDLAKTVVPFLPIIERMFRRSDPLAMLPQLLPLLQPQIEMAKLSARLEAMAEQGGGGDEGGDEGNPLGQLGNFMKAAQSLGPLMQMFGMNGGGAAPANPVGGREGGA